MGAWLFSVTSKPPSVPVAVAIGGAINRKVDRSGGIASPASAQHQRDAQPACKLARDVKRLLARAVDEAQCPRI